MRIEAARYLRSMLLLGGLLLFPAAASLLAHAFGLSAVVGAWLSGPRREPPPPPPSDVSAPPPGWRERTYLAANPDVAAAVRAGAFRSGYEHYRLAGVREGRRGGLPEAPAAAGAPPDPAPAPRPAPAAAPLPSPAAAPPAPPPAAVPLPLPLPSPPAAAPAVALVPPPPVKPAPATAAPRPDPPEAAAPAPPSSAPAAPAAPAAVETAALETGAVVRAVRFGRHPGFLRMVLESSDRLPAQPRLAPDGRGLTLALDGVGWAAPRRWTGGPAALITGYELEEAGGAGRFVLRAARPLALRHVMRLPPEGRAGHRLVIDLEPADGMP